MSNRDKERMRMNRMIQAIDKRVAVFELIGEEIYYSDGIYEALGFCEDAWEDLLSNREQFMEFIKSNSIEMDMEDDTFEKYIGILDHNEKYVILNAFKEGEDIYGFIVDKTAEIWSKSKLMEELGHVLRRSQTDQLTGLLNRAGFEEVVKKALSLYSNRGALVIMDMDNFKLVNDMMGHPEGDKVLKAFGEVLTSVVPSDIGIVGRIGGDEFVIFFTEEVSYSYMDETLDELMKAVHHRFDDAYPEQHLSASIGAVLVGAGLCDYEELYKSADKVLYSVKENGKGHYRIK